MMMHRIILLGACIAALPVALRAQGSLGSQGFGYPTGQLSSGALATGGSTAEIDPSSSVNPAALASPSRYAIYMQFEPEFRRTSGRGIQDRSTTIRFPGFMATGGYQRVSASLSFSTLLDRTWSNTYSDSQLVGGQMYESSLRAASAGAINDTRFAVSYYVSPKLQVGLGIHSISGENRIEFGRAFADSTGLGSIGQQSSLNYSGRAMSLGAMTQPIKGLVIAGSARFGGEMRALRDTVVISTADVPSRYGIGVTWFGIPNTTLGARYERTSWSDMQRLGSDSLSVFDATELGLGLDVAGPRLFGAASIVRLGVRDRTLPFGVDGNRVSERSISGGVGIPLARGRAQLDLTLQRAFREAAGLNERSWFVGIGLGIRP